MIGLGPALSQAPWQEKLRRTLQRRRGARLGEATVVSRQVHMSDPRVPQAVTILTGADAGETFYGRTVQGEVIHLDIFHDVADVDHHRVAGALRWALAGVQLSGGGEPGAPLMDYFDLMTGTGGGRVTGDLSYGKKESLRVAHRNHVHLAGFLPDDQLHLLVPIAMAVEEELKAQGVQIRRIERVTHMRDSGTGAPLDLSHYTDYNDTKLRGGGQSRGGAGRSAGTGRPGAGAGQGAEAAHEGGAAQQSLRAGRSGGGGAGATLPATGSAGLSQPPRGAIEGGGGEFLPSPPGAAPGPAPTQTGWDSLEQERKLQAALELSRRLGSPDEVKRVLDELSKEQGWASLYGSGSSQAPFVVRQLEDEGLVRREIRGLRLTEEGKELARYLDQHLRDVKLRFRKLIRRMPASPAGNRDRRRPGPSTAAPSPDVRYGPIRGAARAESGAWLGDLAVPETVRAALTRTHLERIQSGEGPVRGLRLEREDVHVHLRSGEQPLHVCLLIDASASMAGRRILAAKHLARHLLVSTRDRIAVIAFQERDVRVYVPFTRDWTQVEEGLARIQPLGLTPLAHGLTQSLELIRASRVRRPLLLLITDGIPTVPKWTVDPLSDALEAARQVGSGRIPFGCIGLQPSRRYLEELVKAGGGTLHVVEELDEQALVTIAHKERDKIAQRAR